MFSEGGGSLRSPLYLLLSDKPGEYVGRYQFPIISDRLMQREESQVFIFVCRILTHKLIAADRRGLKPKDVERVHDVSVPEVQDWGS